VRSRGSSHRVGSDVDHVDVAPWAARITSVSTPQRTSSPSLCCPQQRPSPVHPKPSIVAKRMHQIDAPSRVNFRDFCIDFRDFFVANTRLAGLKSAVERMAGAWMSARAGLAPARRLNRMPLLFGPARKFSRARPCCLLIPNRIDAYVRLGAPWEDWGSPPDGPFGPSLALHNPRRSAPASRQFLFASNSMTRL